ncbi:MAG: TolB family protein [Bacillota bacterium]|nr:hypothetical protein [Candidatus Fermentithermobacillaceae bacterium]
MRADLSFKPILRTRPIIRITLLLVCVAMVLSQLSGCAKPEPKTVATLDPVEIRTLSFIGRLDTRSEDRCISPDGKYLLAAVLGEKTDRMVAIPLGSDDALSPDKASSSKVSGDEASPDEVSTGEVLSDAITLYEADTSWTHHNLVQWFPLGWTLDSECVFAIHGWQAHGPHKGKRGTAIYTADIESGNATLISYVDVPEQGQIIEEAVLAEDGKVYVRISGQFLEYDLESRTHRLVRDDLPSYYGISVVTMSPKGDQIVYSVYGEDKSGVYIFDVASGAEKPLVETGKSLSFYPSWSPDGEYISMYTVHRVDDASASGVARYDMVYGEDGPRPSAQEITIVDPQGTVVRSISMEGQYLSHAYWLADGGSLVFVSGPVAFGKWGEVLSAEYEAVWIADVAGDSAPVKVADLASIEAETGKLTPFVYPVASLPEGAGALLTVVGAKGPSVWLVSPAAPPSKVADGQWQTSRLTPVYIDSVVGIISDGIESSVYLVGHNGATRLGDATPAMTSIVAYSDDLLVTSSYDFGENRTEANVYRMVSEKTVE